MKNLSQKAPCIRASGGIVMHIHMPRVRLDGLVRIGRKSDGFDPSGLGENHARAIKFERSQNERR